jgi:hypothetical protein
VAFVMYTRLLLSYLHKKKITSFISLSCHLKKQMNHRSTLERLNLGNYAATQLWEDCLAQLPGNWVSESSVSALQLRCCFLYLRCSVQSDNNIRRLRLPVSFVYSRPWSTEAI